ncbi:MAG: glycosyltransferase [Bryobacterales bacterium]|nr:glycosyltransferase [Bryobacterales bacterium]MBV9401073.1 glycosyltransferase [Bryobacterales bacterium]
MQPAPTPRILWVELTSKCPFDCTFCSRKMRRGSGAHMPYALFQSLVEQVRFPRKLLLNYSGESTVYPELIAAIRLARSTGAAVELVTALASASDSLLEQLSASGLTRLTISIHATEPKLFDEIYRYSCFDALRTRLERMVKLCRAVDRPPSIDVAFVAMQKNLGEMYGVAELMLGLGLRILSVFPVIRRDEIPVVFPQELTPNGRHREEFREQVAKTVENIRDRYGIAATICNPLFANPGATTCEFPAPCAGDLPAGARIHSCEQNPWETAHVLSNGDVVACEVHDKTPLGNLARQSLAEIWHGQAYRRFRENYQLGQIPECRACPWKTAYIPARLRGEIVSSRGRSAQFWHGWHEPANEPHIWASQQAVAILQPRQGARVLHVNGALPPGPCGEINRLEVLCNDAPAGEVTNDSRDTLFFGVDFTLPESQPGLWRIEFRTRHLYAPPAPLPDADQRDLAFALILLSSRPPLDEQTCAARKQALLPWVNAIRNVDRLARRISPALRRKLPGKYRRTLTPGLSIIIPERDNLERLRLCLRALREALQHWREPAEVLVVVNGCHRDRYRALAKEYAGHLWQFHPKPLGFAAAIASGLNAARHDWVYLLNSDVVLDPNAITAAAGHRGPLVFSIASQIMLEDRTRFREETNWTTLLLENGIATTHDLIPDSSDTVEHFYSGAGAAMFQRKLLSRLIDSDAYHPFYWEDVEWGWRARKLGYRSLFCAGSIAHHTQRATISKYYSPEEIENIFERNRFLFQLRNLTSIGSLEAIAEAISRAEPAIAENFRRPSEWVRIAKARLWNHAAPVPDEVVLAGNKM